MDMSLVPWWGWVLVGSIAWFFVQNFVLRDSDAIWLAERKNGSAIFVALGIIGFLFSLGSLIRGIWNPILEVLNGIKVEWWIIWLIYFFGFSVMVFFLSKIKIPKNKTNVNKTGEKK